jgi:4-alpha-glucanotransferase
VDGFLAAHRNEYEFWQYTQFLFVRQWQALKQYAADRQIAIMGDMPFYVAQDSMEMWKYRDRLFLLNDKGSPSKVAGVPPDAFSEDGQLWGNPVYDWEKLAKSNYSWWKRRIGDALSFFDVIRIDHFRAFDRFYAIPAGAKSAKQGEWLPASGAKLFSDLKDLNIVAEDLGMIDEGVRSLMRQTGFPGMKVLEFAFDGNPYNEHKPSNTTENYIAYTGTHDNEPFMAYLNSKKGEERELILRDIHSECKKSGTVYRGNTDAELCKTVIRLLFSERANVVIVPVHDILELGIEARINHPSVVSRANWSYRLLPNELSESSAHRMYELCKRTDRLPKGKN